MSFENNFNEEEEILKATVKLSFAAQCQHAHWKVRSRAYESMVSSSSFDDDFAKDGTKETKTNDYERKNFEIIDYFKEAMHKIVSETNANALDVALERTNQRLRKMIDRELVSFFNTSSSSSKITSGSAIGSTFSCSLAIAKQRRLISCGTCRTLSGSGPRRSAA